MSTAETLQLYHPMTLQSMPNTPASHHHHATDYPTTRNMLGLPNRTSHHLGGPASGMDYGQHRQMGLYSPGQGPHSAGPAASAHYMSSEVPLSAPPSLSSNHPFSSQHSQQQNVYPSFSPRLSHSSQGEHPPSQGYYNDGHSHSGSAPGSGYATPQ